MQPLQSIDILNFHEPLWTRLEPMLQNNKVAQAMLFIGPPHVAMMQFVNRLMSRLLCQQSDAPCGQCQACRMIIQGAHPDIHYVLQETTHGPIKIEQIRYLQSDVYQTPQRGKRRFIVITPADKLNVQASNALLKILEEPPAHTYFILMAHQLGSLLPTILSRCQQYIVEQPHDMDCFSIGQRYEEGTARAILFQNRTLFIEQLCALVDDKTTPSTIATEWSQYAIDDILWFLYLWTLKVIRYSVLRVPLVNQEDTALDYFSKAVSLMKLFEQIEKINSLTRKSQQNITLNQTLVIESLLLGYISC